MVVSSRQATKAVFSKRLHEALDEMPECPKDKGRPGWVARRYQVSTQGAAKWLDALSIPDQTNMARVAADLRVCPCWLHTGQPPKRPTLQDQEATNMQEIWRDLDDTGKHEVLSFARYRARHLPNDPKPPVENADGKHQ